LVLDEKVQPDSSYIRPGVGNLFTITDRQTDNACLFYMANEKTQRSSMSADHGSVTGRINTLRAGLRYIRTWISA